MDKKLLVALLLGCLIYLKINEGKKNYLCYCVIALVSFGLLTAGKAVEGFNGTEGPFNDKGVLITYTGVTAEIRSAAYWDTAERAVTSATGSSIESLGGADPVVIDAM